MRRIGLGLHFGARVGGWGESVVWVYRAAAAAGVGAGVSGFFWEEGDRAGLGHCGGGGGGTAGSVVSGEEAAAHVWVCGGWLEEGWDGVGG